MPVQEFDRYARNYSKDIEETLGVFGKGHDFYVRSKADILSNLFGSLGGESGIKVLDVGCGVGLVHPLIVGLGRRAAWLRRLRGFDRRRQARQPRRHPTNRRSPGRSLTTTTVSTAPTRFASCITCPWPMGLLHARDGAGGEARRHRGFHRAQPVQSRDPVGREQLPDRQGRGACEAIQARQADGRRRRQRDRRRAMSLFTPFEGKAFRRLDDILSARSAGRAVCERLAHRTCASGAGAKLGARWAGSPSSAAAAGPG